MVHASRADRVRFRHVTPGSPSRYFNSPIVWKVPVHLESLCQRDPVKVVGQTLTGYRLRCIPCNYHHGDEASEITLCGARVGNWKRHTRSEKHEEALKSFSNGEAIVAHDVDLQNHQSDEEIAAHSNSQEEDDSQNGAEDGLGGIDDTWDPNLSLAAFPARLPMEPCTTTAFEQSPFPPVVSSMVPHQCADDPPPYAGAAVSDGSPHLSTGASETGYDLPPTAGQWLIPALQTETDPSNTGQTDADITDPCLSSQAHSSCYIDLVSQASVSGSVRVESISHPQPSTYAADYENRMDYNCVQAADQPQLNADTSSAYNPDINQDSESDRAQLGILDKTQHIIRSIHPSGQQNLYPSSGAFEAGQSSTDQISIPGTVDTTAFTRYKTPLITYWDECLNHFLRWLKNNPTFISVIRRYSGPEETLYIAFVRQGEVHRLDSVGLRGPASFRTVAVEFFNQTNDPLIRRAVWGHGRFTRDESMPFLYSGLEVKKMSDEGSNFDIITPSDANSWLPQHHQVKLTMEHNLAKPNVNLEDLIRVFKPAMNNAYQNLLVDYVYAVLAALYKLQTNEKKIYLEHQRTYLNAWIRLDWTCFEEANIHTYPETTLPVYGVYQAALKLILDLLGAIAKSVDSCNLCPTPEQISAARDLGLYISFSSIEASRVSVLYGPQVQVAFMNQIKPHRDVLEKAVYPKLIPNYLEAEYAIYGRKAHEAHLYHIGEFPELPTGDVRIFSSSFLPS
ncbi:hypothetical protein MVEN_00029500 [Mycena venus]|uniref:Uncharacterized protein n=1 Tax=Mycena venus TaxID=2733690 RepID=A0A8H6Z345_9AGAR|nr:hypothetical protein MVEN_00029500 [Mycena venus]